MRAIDTPAPTPGMPNPSEVPTGEPLGVPAPEPEVIDPSIGIPTGPGPGPAVTPPGTPGAPTSPGVGTLRA